MMLTSGESLFAGVPVGFKLAPAPSPPMYAHPTNEHARRGAFATKQLWVTPYSDDEKFPAGKYPLGGDMAGIEAWTSLVSPFFALRSMPSGAHCSSREWE